MYIENTKEELKDLLNQIDDNREALGKITSSTNIMLKKLTDKPNLEKLEITEKKLKELQVNNQILIEKCRLLEKSDKDTKIIKQDNIMLNMVYNKLYKLFPQQIDDVIQEIDNENKQPK